ATRRSFRMSCATPIAYHERGRVLGGDDVRQDRLPEDRRAVCQVRGPEPPVLTHHRVLAGDAVAEEVEPAVFAITSAEKRLDLGLEGVVDAKGNRRAACADDHL